MGPLLILVILIVVYMLFKPTAGQKKKQSCAMASRSDMNASHPESSPLLNDYNEYLLTAGLDRGVIDSHKQFVNDVAQTTSGASTLTALSGDVDDNKWVGLRRPNYNVYVDPEARQVTSAEQWQYPNAKRYDSSGLF